MHVRINYIEFCIRRQWNRRRQWSLRPTQRFNSKCAMHYELNYCWAGFVLHFCHREIYAFVTFTVLNKKSQEKPRKTIKLGWSLVAVVLGFGRTKAKTNRKWNLAHFSTEFSRNCK